MRCFDCNNHRTLIHAAGTGLGTPDSLIDIYNHITHVSFSASLGFDLRSESKE